MKQNLIKYQDKYRCWQKFLLLSIDYFREGTTGGQDDNNTVGDQDATASGVPGWTWGVIGGIVLIALVAGGFILSRGEGGGDEGKDWDY